MNIEQNPYLCSYVLVSYYDNVLQVRTFAAENNMLSNTLSLCHHPLMMPNYTLYPVCLSVCLSVPCLSTLQVVHSDSNSRHQFKIHEDKDQITRPSHETQATTCNITDEWKANRLQT